MNSLFERMENIPFIQVFQERPTRDKVPIQSQTPMTDDQPQTLLKLKVEEKDNADTKFSSGNCDLSIANQDQTVPNQLQKTPPSSPQNTANPMVALLTNCQPTELHEQKLLPSRHPPSTLASRPNKISIHSLLNSDNDASFSDNNMDPIPSLHTVMRKKRELESSAGMISNSESKKPCVTSPVDQPAPIEAQVVSFAPPVLAPAPAAFVPQYVAFPVAYQEPQMLPGAQSFATPVEGLLAMATAASELGEAPDSNAGSPGQPSSPTAPGPIQELYDELWMKHFNQLKEFKTQFGHCNVTRTKAEWKSLGNWVAEQRRKMRQGKLTQQQYEMLSTQGFEWDRSYFFKAAVPIQAMYEESLSQPTSPHATRKATQKKI